MAISELRSAQRKTTKPAMPKFDAGTYSAAHAPHIALLDEYFDRVWQQERSLVAAGHPADGLTEFIIKWFTAWERRDVELLRDCMTDDLVYADPTGGSRDYYGTQLELFDCYALIFKVVPDLIFYPQDRSAKALPMYDFDGDTVRLLIPWRMIGRPRLSPRAINSVGVDRYCMVRDAERGWLIQRIDTDGDLLFALGQLVPFFPITGVSQAGLRRFLKLLHRIAPSLKGPQVRPMIYDEHGR